MPQCGALPAARLLPLLAGRLRGLVYRCRPYLLSMHAAALNWRGRTLLLSGPSGSGKSTLAATLLARGGELLSDEPVVLDEQGAVLPLPVPLMLKEASWPLLAAAIPGLMEPPQVLRFDGTPLRYLDATLIPFAAAPVPGTPLLRKLPCQADSLKVEFSAFFNMYSAGVRSPSASCGRCSL